MYVSQNVMCQVNDTLYGDVKHLKSYVTFQDSTIQNEKLFSSEGDYGHYGFSSKEFAMGRWKNWWYNTHFVHYINVEKSFNKKKQLVKESWFYKNGNLVYQYKYVYDKKDRLISELEYSDYDSDRIGIKKYGYKYDGKIATILETNIGHDYHYSNMKRFQYDNKDRMIRTDVLYGEGEMSSTIIEYDSINNIRRTYTYSEDQWVKSGDRSHTLKNYPKGMIYLKKVESLDHELKVVKSVEYSERDYNNQVKKIDSSLYSYQNGNLIKIEKSYGRLGTNLNTFKYDSKNRLIEEIRTYSDRENPILKTQYKYDEYDQVIKLIYYEGEFGDSKPLSVEIDFELQYDDRGNWIEQKKIVDGVHLFTWHRVINYWD